MAKKNIFIVGIDDFNLGELNAINQAENYEFHGLFQHKDLQKKGEKIDIKAILDGCRAKLNDFSGNIDAIIGYYDFPITLIAYLLCEEYDLSAPSFASGVKCEHKYWSRLEQAKVIPEHIPEFEAVNPMTHPNLEQINLAPPFWLKPVKAYSSQLGFKINDQDELEYAVERVQEQIEIFADPFNYLLRFVTLPEEIKAIDGGFCIAEKLISGHQCTLSGYVYDHEVITYGIVDSINYEEKPSFFYYLFPSKLPQNVQDRMKDISEKVIKQISFNHSPFNIEFFYDEKQDKLHLLEINPRMSQSHSDLYAKVSGSSNHQILVELALGKKPEFNPYAGEYKYAAKFHHCVFEGDKVKNVPSDEQVKSVETEFPETIVLNEAKEGQPLSEELAHDSYSYRLATIFTGADSTDELRQKYRKILDKLNYIVE